jgi:hypothetical protein
MYEKYFFNICDISIHFWHFSTFLTFWWYFVDTFSTFYNHFPHFSKKFQIFFNMFSTFSDIFPTFFKHFFNIFRHFFDTFFHTFFLRFSTFCRHPFDKVTVLYVLIYIYGPTLFYFYSVSKYRLHKRTYAAFGKQLISQWQGQRWPDEGWIFKSKNIF